MLLYFKVSFTSSYEERHKTQQSHLIASFDELKINVKGLSRQKEMAREEIETSGNLRVNEK